MWRISLLQKTGVIPDDDLSSRSEIKVNEIRMKSTKKKLWLEVVKSSRKVVETKKNSGSVARGRVSLVSWWTKHSARFGLGRKSSWKPKSSKHDWRLFYVLSKYRLEFWTNQLSSLPGRSKLFKYLSVWTIAVNDKTRKNLIEHLTAL